MAVTALSSDAFYTTKNTVTSCGLRPRRTVQNGFPATSAVKGGASTRAGLRRLRTAGHAAAEAHPATGHRSREAVRPELSAAISPPPAHTKTRCRPKRRCCQRKRAQPVHLYATERHAGGVFVSNDGPHIYNQQALVHGDLYAPGKRADYHRALAAEAAARAKADVAERGLVAVVVQDYYAMAVPNASSIIRGRRWAKPGSSWTSPNNRRRGGETAHSDVIKAQIQWSSASGRRG